MAAGADAVVCLVTTPPDRGHEIATALVEQRLAACVNIHPYDTFELIALDVTAGAAPYLSWIGESVDAG